jgi:hypothetical protein
VQIDKKKKKNPVTRIITSYLPALRQTLDQILFNAKRKKKSVTFLEDKRTSKHLIMSCREPSKFYISIYDNLYIQEEQ